MSCFDKVQIAKISNDAPLESKKWKPTFLEKTMLESQFQKNQFPSQENRRLLSKRLHATFDTNVSTDELQEWFEEEMSKTSKRLKTDNLSANSYIKLTTEEVNILEGSFEMKNYPNIEEMQEMAEKLGVNLPKIENWFKHHRRSLAKKGQFHIKTKKYFQPNDLKILMSVFLKTPHPTPQEISIVAQQLNCTESQIKNWYSNKRKRVRNLNKNLENVNDESLSSSSSPNSSSTTQSLEYTQAISISDLSLNSLTRIPNEHSLMSSLQPASQIFDPRNSLSFLKDLNSSSLNLSYPLSLQNIQQYQNFLQAQDLNSNKFFSQPLCNIFSGPKNAVYQPNILNLQFTDNNMGLGLSNSQRFQNLVSSQRAFQNNFLVQNSSLDNSKLFNWRNRVMFSQYGNSAVQGKAYS